MLIFLLECPIPRNKIGAKIGFFLVRFPHSHGLTTLVMRHGIEKLAILAGMEVFTTMFTGIRSFDFIDELKFASACMT